MLITRLHTLPSKRAYQGVQLFPSAAATGNEGWGRRGVHLGVVRVRRMDMRSVNGLSTPGFLFTPPQTRDMQISKSISIKLNVYSENSGAPWCWRCHCVSEAGFKINMGLIVSELTSCLVAEKEKHAWLRKAQLHMMPASSPAKIATIADILNAHKNKIKVFVLDVYSTLTHSLDTGATGLFHK